MASRYKKPLPRKFLARFPQCFDSNMIRLPCLTRVITRQSIGPRILQLDRAHGEPALHLCGYLRAAILHPGLDVHKVHVRPAANLDIPPARHAGLSAPALHSGEPVAAGAVRAGLRNHLGCVPGREGHRDFAVHEIAAFGDAGHRPGHHPRGWRARKGARPVLGRQSVLYDVGPGHCVRGYRFRLCGVYGSRRVVLSHLGC